jgi:hypothetical protein
MVETTTSFRDFKHQGWSVERVAVGYHDCFSGVTTQAIEALLDAAGVGRDRDGRRMGNVVRGFNEGELVIRDRDGRRKGTLRRR